MPTIDYSLDLVSVRNFAIALLIGALVGIEREKSKIARGNLGVGGLRTFILFAELGAVAAWLSLRLDNLLLLISVLVVAVSLVIANYLMEARTNPGSAGLTTEVAALVVCLLGAMSVLGYPELAVGLAITTSAVLAYKQPLHGIVEKLGWDDIFAFLRLLIASFIVLPLLPDQPLEIFPALNPYKFWLLVILISSLSLLGYVTTRLLGSRKGEILTALTGGLVSSTAVTLSLARRRAADSVSPNLLASALLVAWTVMFVRVVVEVLIVNSQLLWAIIVPFSAMGAVALTAACFFYLRDRKLSSKTRSSDKVALKNPFSLTEAGKFALFFLVIMALVYWCDRYVSDRYLYLVAALAGLTDMDAITLTMAEQAQAVNLRTPALAILTAAISNTIVKCGLVIGLGAPALRLPIIVSTVLIVIAGAACGLWCN